VAIATRNSRTEQTLPRATRAGATAGHTCRRYRGPRVQALPRATRAGATAGHACRRYRGPHAQAPRRHRRVVVQVDQDLARSLQRRD
jgi:hypothetical protein